MPVRLFTPLARARRRSSSSTRLRATVAVATLVLGIVGATRGELATQAADAAVTPTSGFAATVSGWTSWYGAYGLADLGWAWCIDHGSSAPDPELGYAPTTIDAESDPTTRAAMAWAVTMNPPHDPVTAAAIMLALHDLRDASYPFGELDVDRLGPADLAGFGGNEGAVVDRARAVKGDALAHAHLRGPFTLAVTADRAEPGRAGALRATLADAAGAPVAGVAVTVEVGGATLSTGPLGFTGDDGVAWFGFQAGAGENRFVAHADLPRTEPSVHAPTVAPAQRVIIAAWSPADGADAYAPAPPTTTTLAPSTTTTTLSPTTTTRPSTTTTSSTTTSSTTTSSTTTSSTTTSSTTTTTRPSTTTTTSTTTSTTTPTTSSTAPATSTTSSPSTTATTITAAPVPSSPTAAGPAPPGSPPRATTLPVTGRSSWPWALIGTGLLLCGSSLTGAARRPSRARSSR